MQEKCSHLAKPVHYLLGFAAEDAQAAAALPGRSPWLRMVAREMVSPGQGCSALAGWMLLHVTVA